jgi:hypothetical protein
VQSNKRERHQAGRIYEASGKFYVQYRRTEIINGKPERVQRSEFLCDKDTKYYNTDCKAVKLKRDEFMLKVNSGRANQSEFTIVDYWTGTYLPYAERNLRASTVRGYKQIWSQHLEKHFGATTMRDYTTGMASRFLGELAKHGYGRNTLNHIRTTASALFTHALQLEYVNANPWHGARSLEKVERA